MKTTLAFIIAAIGLALASDARAQDAKKSETQEKSPAAPAQAASEKPKPSQEELEATFKTTLTQATLTGRWCSIKEGQLGPEKDDKYTILEVTKLGGDVWLIKSRIQYGKKDIVAPIPVQVKWAGDTPVIVVDKVGVPGGGTYSARVLIFEKNYAGTWTGGEHGGLLNGVISKTKTESPR